MDRAAVAGGAALGCQPAARPRIEDGEESREKFMRDIAAFADSTVHELDAKLKEVRIPRANLGPCPVCGHDIVENRKGFSCWSREDPGCGFVIWKSKAGKTLASDGSSKTAKSKAGSTLGKG